MEFISVHEAALRWGVSDRRVQRLCEDTRIEGLARFGRSWMIPDDAEKPPDARRAPSSAKNETNGAIQNGGDPRAHERRMNLLAEHWHAREYDAILSMRLTNMAVALIDGTLFVDVAEDLLDNCPHEIKKKHPLSMLRIAYALAGGGRALSYRRAMAEAREIIERSGLPDGERRQLMGEWEFASIFARFPDLEGMLGLLENATRLTGGRTELIDSSEPFMFGCTGIFGTFHTRPGMLRSEVKTMSKFVKLYSAMTGGGGLGADIVFDAERRYYQGDIAGADELCRRAYSAAMSGGQDLICMGAAHIRAEIAVFLADIDAFNEAYAAMCAAAEMRRENAPLCEKILDLCRAGLNLHIGNNSETPEWILQGETNGIPDNCRNWATFLRVSHSSLNPDLHGAADLAKMSLAEMDGRYVLFRSLIMLLASALFSGLQQGGHAGEMLSAAGEMLNPDDLYQFYGPFYYAMPQGIDEYISTLPSKAAKAIHKARRQYLKGRVVIHDAVFQQRRPDGLTRRERETAELAAKGMRNKEIAAELGISTETVRTHLAKVHQKLLIDRRALIAEKLRMGRS